MRVPFLDLKAQYSSVREEVERRVLDVLGSQQFILGPYVAECEKAVASYCSCSYGVGVSSGTDALLVSLMAQGVGPGDEVVTSPYSFVAAAECIARLGARPVFADIDPTTFTLDPQKLDGVLTSRTKAVIPVHLFGQMADMSGIMEVLTGRDIAVIEDAAQAIGAEREGRRAGSVGRCGCLSFFPSKNLGGAGDGGMVVTKDPDCAKRVALLRSHGAFPKYHHKLVGGNFRLDELQAAVILAKLPHLDEWTELRRRNAARYGQLFRASGMVERGLVILPEVRSSRHVFNQYVIRVPRRDDLKRFLAQRGVSTQVYYPVPLHLQECFRHLGYGEGSMPEAERATKETLALPVFPGLTDEQAEYVVESMRRFF